MRPGSDGPPYRRRGADGRFISDIREHKLQAEYSRSDENVSRLGDEDYEAMVEASRAKKEVDDAEAAEAAATRIVWSDNDVATLLTSAMMVKFALCWGDCKLQCSGDADALSRLPEILVWLENVRYPPVNPARWPNRLKMT